MDSNQEREPGSLAEMSNKVCSSFPSELFTKTCDEELWLCCDSTTDDKVFLIQCNNSSLYINASKLCVN